MADLKFGVGQFGKETPHQLKLVFRIVLYLSGLWTLLAPVLTNIEEVMRGKIDHWIVIGLMVMRFTISFFHLDFDETGS